MNSLVVYDSNFGNTQKVAETIAQELGGKAKQVSTVSLSDIEKVNLLVVGSPINGWRATEKITYFLKNLKDNSLQSVDVAAFDTRVKLFFHGDAAGKIARALKKAGANVVAKPEGFFVMGQKGPLFEGELERAKNWASTLKTV